MGLLPSAEFFEGIFERMKGKALLREDDLLLWTYLRGLPPFDRILGEMSRFRVFQLSPTEARKAGATSGSQELGKHGDNLPAVLDWLKREQPLGFDRLLNYARQAVPTIDAIETDYTDTREMGLYLRERGIQRRLFASELSDGTVRTLAMFLPLIDPRVRLAVIEEPENSIHPWVVREFVEACRLCSANKQIILTTHSPVLVSKLEPHELYVAERARGETAILQATRANVELEQVIRKGIQDLGSYWDSGAMQAVPGDPQGLLEFMDSDGKGR
jgi:predicted ATPase